MSILELIDRGRNDDYLSTLELQRSIQAEKILKPLKPDVLIMVEHLPVYTVGRSIPFQRPVHSLAAQVPWHEIGRGGEATYHGPGQLVAYPIFSLDRTNRDVHLFMRKLEEAIIDTLDHCLRE